jgi:hypothetical protein
LSRILEKVSSLHITIWNLVALLLWTGWGMLMASQDAYTKGFNRMNSVLLRDWLFSGKSGSGVLKVWFIGLCVLMILLGINLIFCSWEKIFRIIRARFNGAKFYMLIVHCIFGLVALGHLGGLMLGYKHNDIQLGEGKKYSFGDGYEIEVKDINFVSDPKVLYKTKKFLTRDNFDYRANSAEVVLYKNGEELSRKDLFIYDPMGYKDMQVTLKNFIVSPEAEGEKTALNSKPWVSMAVSRNPVLRFFLVLYPLMIAGIFIHLILTWRSPATGRPVQEASNSD